jgi:hypothetical protein
MPSEFSVRIRGVGPIYVATETKCPVRAVVSRAWITEMAPPYRKGNGWRLRVGRFAVQVGTCTKHPEVSENILGTLIEHVGWRSFPWRPDAGPGDPLGEGDEGRAGDQQVR